ncbi:MAG: TetR/AcrR family transcriptional regulator [Clostridia bacterium]|nr:TetR/AcrR family transcriptional regulator [Clostridia bacterium]
MAKKENTKSRIVSAAWELFYETGYENTTVDQIIEKSGTSKGSFYHYFDGKDALLSSLSYLFDEMYDRLKDDFTPEMKAVDRLVYLNREVFKMIENRISVDLLARLLSTQLVTRSERHLLDQSRTYYKLLRRIILDGQESGELTDTLSANEIVKAYAVFERAVMYDWCICGGDYSLCRYGESMVSRFLDGYLKKAE